MPRGAPPVRAGATSPADIRSRRATAVRFQVGHGVRAWNLADGGREERHTDRIGSAFAIAPDGSLIAAPGGVPAGATPCCRDPSGATAWTCGIRSGIQCTTVPSPGTRLRIDRTAFSADGRRVLALVTDVDRDRTSLRLWDLRRRQWLPPGEAIAVPGAPAWSSPRTAVVSRPYRAGMWPSWTPATDSPWPGTPARPLRRPRVAGRGRRPHRCRRLRGRPGVRPGCGDRFADRTVPPRGGNPCPRRRKGRRAGAVHGRAAPRGDGSAARRTGTRGCPWTRPPPGWSGTAPAGWGCSSRTASPSTTPAVRRSSTVRPRRCAWHAVAGPGVLTGRAPPDDHRRVRGHVPPRPLASRAPDPGVADDGRSARGPGTARRRRVVLRDAGGGHGPGSPAGEPGRRPKRSSRAREHWLWIRAAAAWPP
ncbi:hypothetical protein SGLAM104S_07856 [Streptomyces glaucescens]